MTLRCLYALVTIGGGLSLLGLAGCGDVAPAGCAESAGCLAISAPALPAGALLDSLEVVARTDSKLVRTQVTDRVLRPPLSLNVALPERAAGERLTLYLRATASAQTGQPLGGSVDIPAAQAGPHAVSLRAPCAQESCAAPSARQGAALAYDAASRQLVLFGGAAAGGAPLADTWAWDGVGWHQLTWPGSPGPSARTGHSLVYDQRGGRLVLFGGLGAGGPQQPLGDAWQLDTAKGWQRLSDTGAGGASSPEPRWQAAMASTRDGVVLFGGLAATGTPLADTWLLDGSGWRQTGSGSCAATPASSPRCRRAATLASDGMGGALLLGGWLGEGEATPTFDDVVWGWDGQSWSQPAIYRPPVVLNRFAHAAAFAAFPQASPALLVGFGEAQSGVLRADSFLLDLHPGATTGQFAPQLGAAPPARREAALAYDDERGELLLFGGLGASGALGDTWRFEPAGHWSQR